MAHFINHSERSSDTPRWQVRCKSPKPTQTTLSLPEVFAHDKGTLQDEHKMKNWRKAFLYSSPPAFLVEVVGDEEVPGPSTVPNWIQRSTSDGAGDALRII